MGKKKNFVKVESDQCKGCRVCVSVCPKGCLSIGSKINKIGYQHVKFEDKGCTGCGICFYVCPELGTLTVHKGEEEEEK